jgi:cardiolipin synthase
MDAITDSLFPAMVAAHLALAAAFSLAVVSRKREPAVTMAWTLSFFFIPILGWMFYLFFGYQRLRLRRRRKPNPAHRAWIVHGGQPSLLEPPANLDPDLGPIERLATHLTEFPVTAGNQVHFYEEPQSTTQALTEHIQSARHHIHMEYYIFEPDDTGLRVRDLLIQQAEKGVECRLLLDAAGSFQLSKRFLHPLQQAGVKVAFFGPFRLFRQPWGYHLRNHRKLTIIDGTVAFIGSQNIGRGLLNLKSRRVSGRETDMRVEGPAVDQLQTIFAEDWGFTTRENLIGDNYFPKPNFKGTSLVQTLPTGPDGKENAFQLIFLAAIHSARKRVTITTPYFIPSKSMSLAVEGAARRGVRVDLLLPKRTDHLVVAWAGRSWYRELLESGVRIFEHKEKFIHAKVLTVDNRLAMVGSANMDVRSFLINFESSLLIYDSEAVSHLQSTFDRTIQTSGEVSLKAIRAQPFFVSLLEGACRVLSPLL